ncbi:MAG: LysR family transcriptional regulator [Lachnospiraceae bacterium]|nr:LysR family transcriptional regulator [Lachnospiraceae bacterium]MDY5741401.1 LysR family transcriptional regulator [Lachnospiraceae bacterium]
MTLQQLRYAILVAEKGSMSEAAASLFIAQPSLSVAIRDLEREIGITIFNRSNRGMIPSNEGQEFLGYARQVLEQSDLLEQKYLGKKPRRQKFSVSTQHYSFAVNAFVNLIKQHSMEEYDFTLRESRTYEVIDDVRNLKSEIGILYLNEFNQKVLGKLIKENDLRFEELFKARPHVFISKDNPLAKQELVQLEDLEDYPCLRYEQGDWNSFYFSEEILSTMEHRKNIQVSDRATLFNLMIGLNGYTMCTGIISTELNGPDIISVPLAVNDVMRVGILTHTQVELSRLGKQYYEVLREYTAPMRADGAAC